MAKGKRPRAIGKARVLLRSLEDLVDAERWNLDAGRLAEWRDRPWAGADVVVCAEAPAGCDGGDGGDTVVVTPFPGELSWLIDYLQQVFGGLVDYRNKYTFYGRLADAAIRYHATRAPQCLNPKDLCFAVIREAARMLDEERRGGFADRDSVTLRGVEVQLTYVGASAGPHMALWRHPVEEPVDLEGMAFTHRGVPWRMGPVMHRATDEGMVTCIAGFAGDGATGGPPDGA